MELMKEDSLTSEEKLLRLIRKKGKAIEASSPSFQENQTTVSPDPPEEAQKLEKPMDVLALSIRVLAVTACIILIFLLNKYALLRTKPPAGQALSPPTHAAENISPSTKEEEEEGLPVAAIEVRPFDVYKPAMEGRDIFQAPWEKPAQEVSAPNASAAELAKQLKLVGILLDKDPKAIVEDLGTHQTFFVSPGEQIGNAVVGEIRPDKVILIFGQEKVELVP
jgi:hypothetical protein